MSSRLDLASLAPALRSRNFRLFWLGQIVSNLGTALQVVAEAWLVYELTRSTFWLGMVGLLALLPVIPISLLGGVLIDRFPRRKLIIATQIGLMAQAATFGLLAQSGNLQLWQIIVLYSIFGALLAIDHPARRAFLADLVDQDVLANAVALNGAIFNFSSFVGYALSGLLIATIGAGGTMMVNALSYLATIAALLAIHVPDVRHDTQHAPLRTAWLEGIVALLEAAHGSGDDRTHGGGGWAGLARLRDDAGFCQGSAAHRLGGLGYSFGSRCARLGDRHGGGCPAWPPPSRPLLDGGQPGAAGTGHPLCSIDHHGSGLSVVGRHRPVVVVGAEPCHNTGAGQHPQPYPRKGNDRL